MRLPLPVQSSPKLAMRALITHCFYRRVIIWAITATFLMCLMLFSGGVHTSHGRILDHLVDFGRTSKGSVESSLSTSTSGSGGSGGSGGSVGQTGISNIWDNEQDPASENQNKGIQDKSTQETSTQDKNTQDKSPQDKGTQDTNQNQGLGAVINPLHWLKYKQ